MSAMTMLAETQGLCPWGQNGTHVWLPWVQFASGEAVTRCLCCKREERIQASPQTAEAE